MNETNKQGVTMSKRPFVQEPVNMFKSCADINNNFDLVFGQKRLVEDFIGGKATFRITFFNKGLGTGTCFVDFKFPKGWTKKKMLSTGLGLVGFQTDLCSLGRVIITKNRNGEK